MGMIRMTLVVVLLLSVPAPFVTAQEAKSKFDKYFGDWEIISEFSGGCFDLLDEGAILRLTQHRLTQCVPKLELPAKQRGIFIDAEMSGREIPPETIKRSMVTVTHKDTHSIEWSQTKAGHAQINLFFIDPQTKKKRYESKAILQLKNDRLLVVFGISDAVPLEDFKYPTDDIMCKNFLVLKRKKTGKNK